MILGQTFQFPLEIALIEWLQQILLSHPFLIRLFSMITELGDAAIPAVFIGFLYWGYDKKSGITMAIQVLLSMMANGMIKNLVMRRRPYFDHEGVECLKAVDDKYDIYDIAGQGFSFPSGHATNSGSFLTSLYLQYRNRKILVYGTVIVFLICLSRIALGVHYPSDVLAGLLLGIAGSALAYVAMERFRKEIVYLCILLIGMTGFFFCHSNDFYSSYGLLIGFMLGDLFEERFIRFENTRNVFRMFLRLIGGAVLFLLIAEGLKIPFSIVFMESDSFLAHLFRSFRYGLACFVSIGIYPYVFRYDIFKLNDRK